MSPAGDFSRTSAARSLAELDAVAGGQPPARLGEGQPAIVARALVQRHLHGDLGASGSGAAALELGGDDLGVVEDHEIAGPQDRRQFAHLAILELVGAHHQQPRGVARAGRISRDQALRQLEVEIG